MEVIGEGSMVGRLIGSGRSFIAGIPRTVNRAVNQRGFLADVFHDVDFAVIWPANFVDVVAHHPERGPDSLAPGNLDAGFESPVRLRELTQRFQARGCVVAAYTIRPSELF